MYAFDMSEEDIRAFKPNGIILSGGPESVHEEGSPRAPQVVFELGVPVLGICYGLQTMSEQLGGKVELLVLYMSLVMPKLISLNVTNLLATYKTAKTNYTFG